MRGMRQGRGGEGRDRDRVVTGCAGMIDSCSSGMCLVRWDGRAAPTRDSHATLPHAAREWVSGSVRAGNAPS